VQPAVYDVLALTQKKITGPGLSALTWNLAYPSTNAGAADGVSFVYDRLGRLSQRSEVGGFATNYTYSANFVFDVKNPRGNVTHVEYLTYDTPERTWPVS